MGTVFIESHDSQRAVGARNESDDDWWQIKKGIYGPNIIGEGVAADIFENVESVALNDVICKAGQKM